MQSNILRLLCTSLLALLPSSLATARPQAGSSPASELYKKASPAVVLIELYDPKGEVSKSGSGFLISSDGEILTNYHVVAHAKRATVRLANEDAYDTVEVVDIDKRKDIALIKIRAVNLPHLVLGSSGTIEVGEKVFSLSNPLGILQNTLSEGIVSGVRQGDGYRYFQMSAPISAGSSGGPVFNSRGEVIGIAVFTLKEGQNLNFAIPIDYAKGMLLSPRQPRSLEAIYEPEPEKPPNPETPEKTGASALPTSTSTPKLAVSEEMRKSSVIYLGAKLGTWAEQDAQKELGEPTRHRFAYDKNNTADGDIYAYPDPTRLMREFELNFDARTKKLRAVYAYPWSMTWEQCKELWGGNASTIKNRDGTRFHSYRNRRLHVLVDRKGSVISIGLY